MTFRADALPFFDTVRPRIFAHRGLHTKAPENSLSAFRAAVEAGVTYIETDIVASRDGVAMISHDLVLDRVAGIPGAVNEKSARELGDIDLGGEGFITLEAALGAFPRTRFNIDVKDSAAIDGLVRAVRESEAQDRVLITSFSTSRRKPALAKLPGVATSATGTEFLRMFTTARLGLIPRVSDQHAIQIPALLGRIPTVTPALLDRYHRAGLEVHVWTVNEPAEMQRLLSMGVDGVVTDRADLALDLVRP
jgi:glycerophosphoryl diester phosphodiesterase